MDNQVIPDTDHTVRHCWKRTWLDEDGDITSAAFKPRDAEEYISVSWIEYYVHPDFDENLNEVRTELASRRIVKPTHKLALLKVGRTSSYVHDGMDDGRQIIFRHKPGTVDDNSHSGIFEIYPDAEIIAELITESVLALLPAVETT